jgi:hypothetical protein
MEDQDDDDDVIITHQMIPFPTFTHVILPNQREKVPITVET